MVAPGLLIEQPRAQVPVAKATAMRQWLAPKAKGLPVAPAAAIHPTATPLAVAVGRVALVAIGVPQRLVTVVLVSMWIGLMQPGWAQVALAGSAVVAVVVCMATVRARMPRLVPVAKVVAVPVG